MLNPKEIESKLKELKPFLSKNYYVNKIGFFGSFANGDYNENSDIDILIHLSQPLGWEFFELEEYLEKELKHYLIYSF